MLTPKEENIVMRHDEDQFFGDNYQVARVNLEEREKDIPRHNGHARRLRNILSKVRNIRSKLNGQFNGIRNYGQDARQTPMA